MFTMQVRRCGCSDEEKKRPDFHAKLGQPCPKPRLVEPEVNISEQVRQENLTNGGGNGGGRSDH